jgi:hypothetical protein
MQTKKFTIFIIFLSCQYLLASSIIYYPVTSITYNCKNKNITIKAELSEKNILNVELKNKENIFKIPMEDIKDIDDANIRTTSLLTPGKAAGNEDIIYIQIEYGLEFAEMKNSNGEIETFYSKVIFTFTTDRGFVGRDKQVPKVVDGKLIWEKYTKMKGDMEKRIE